MRKARRILVAAATAAVLSAVTGSSTATAIEELRSADMAVVKAGIRIAWLRGRSVMNDRNEKIGTISEFVVGRDPTLFAILQVGSFLAFDTYLVAVPFKALIIDDRLQVSLPGATRKALRNLPQFHFAE